MQRRKKLRGLQRRNAISGYLFILPFIIGFLAFMVKPLFQSLYMSFCNVEIGDGSFDMILAGISNYVRAFTVDTEFTRVLAEEIGRMTYNSLAIMVFSFFVALILNQKFKGRALVRAIFFLPVILSSVKPFVRGGLHVVIIKLDTVLSCTFCRIKCNIGFLDQFFHRIPVCREANDSHTHRTVIIRPF